MSPLFSIVLAGLGLPFLTELVAIFVVSVLIAYGCYRLGLVPIAGFLLAGVIIGPGALGLVEDREVVDILAEVGVMLLLFTIGMEFSLDKLGRLGRFILIGGGLQVVLSVLIVMGILLLFGVAPRAGLYTGCLVALSSTAIVLGLLADRSETTTPVGQLSLAILIFQDLAIIVMVLLVPVLSGAGGSAVEVLFVLGRAVLLIAVVLVLARKAVPWLLEKIALARRQELFLLTVVAVCFGTAWITSLADVSLALGAFLAGLVVSESRYREHALSEILPLRTIFNAVFFVSVGMLLDVGFLVQNPLLVLVGVVGVLLLKVFITTGSVLALGYPVRIAAATGLALAQIGEFSFVLERAGRAAGLSPAGLGEAGGQLFIAVTVVLMLATPWLMQAGPRLGRRLERSPLQHLGREPEVDPATMKTAMEDHVVVVGYGVAGRWLVRVLKDTGIPFVIIELNPQSVKEAHREGLPILYGDASRLPILQEAHIARAKLCAIVINDPVAVTRIVQVARHENPTLQIMARTRFLAETEALEAAGADVVVPEELETAVRIFAEVLGAYQVPSDEIATYVRTIRADGYNVLKNDMDEAHLLVLQGLSEEGMHTRAVAVRPGAFAEDKTLAELGLRARYGLTVLTVHRDGKPLGHPPGDYRVRAGDRLVLLGSSEQFAAGASLFREPVSVG